MKLREFLEVCSEPVTVEKFDECGNGTSYEIKSLEALIVKTASALYRGDEYGPTGYEDIYEIWINDGVLTVTLCEPEPGYEEV